MSNKTTEKASENKTTPQNCIPLSHEDLSNLRAPFPKERLGVKVQSVSKNRDRALLVLYLGHTDVMNRLEEVDPAWTTEVLGEERSGDTVYVRMRMTIKGVSRENVGEGGDPKGAYSDALKRCAMLFGVGRYLYDSVTVWADYNEQRDRFKHWSIQDYERFAKGQYSVSSEPTATPSIQTPEAAPPAVATGLTTERPAVGKITRKGPTAQPAPRSREKLNQILMNLYRPYLARFPETRFLELLQARYNVPETRLMTLEQIEDLIKFMEQQLSSAA